MIKIKLLFIIIQPFSELSFTDIVILAVCCFGLTAVAAVLIRLHYKKKFKQLSRQYASPSYSVFVDEEGRVLAACKNFAATYDVFELFDKMRYTDYRMLSRVEKNIPFSTVIKGRDGHEHFVMFFPEKTAQGYHLTGEEASPKTMEFMKKKSGTVKDFNIPRLFSRHKLSWDFEEVRKSLDSQRALYVLFELTNLENYTTLFGMGVSDKIREKIAIRMVKQLKHFGRLYNSGTKNIALLITDEAKIDSFESGTQDIIDNLNKSITIENNILKIQLAAGIVPLDKDLKGKIFESLHRRAVEAIVRAKDSRRDYHVYVPDKIKNGGTDSVALVKRIVSNKNVEVYFQPQYNIAAKKIESFEALCRIKGVDGELLPIIDFIHICEKNGYIIELGKQIFEQAFRFAKEAERFNATISLNVSPLQLLHEDFEQDFIDRYNSFHLKERSISLEITETFLVTSFDKIVEKLKRLYKFGIDIHLDDFGVGYSSMIYLKKLPINAVKIDREFVSDIISNKYSRVICSKIIDISKELNLNIIAEGVETQEQLQVLGSMGCKVIQGYLIGKAMPAKCALELLKKGEKS